MAVVRVIVTMLFVIVCIALTVVVLMQEGKADGLGAIAGGSSNNSYWDKNKGRSMEGNMVRITKILAAAFIILAIVLNFAFN